MLLKDIEGSQSVLNKTIFKVNRKKLQTAVQKGIRAHEKNLYLLKKIFVKEKIKENAIYPSAQ